MQLAIVHYHLNRGGVTQVILNHLRALSATHTDDSPLRILVLYGGRKEAWRADKVAGLDGLDVTLAAIPELEYESPPVAAPQRLARRMTRAMRDAGLDPDDTVVHIHNHALGKSASLPGAVTDLGQAGWALLLQIHDFAEDFRPANYRSLATALSLSDPAALSAAIYPQGSAIHYAVLNGRDYNILAETGFAPPRLHTLPNPVANFDRLPDRSVARTRLARLFGVGGDQPYVVYPVRGIRRKNLGELLLWSAASDPSARFALTLPPLNPVEHHRYIAWKQLAAQLELPLLFDVGAEEGLDFGENLAAADRILTTSVAEGFGMVFLETWLADRLLIGRDLPEITADFTAAGLEFSQLAAEVNIPVDWLDQEEFIREMRASFVSVLEAYGRPEPDAAIFRQEVWRLFDTGLLDFARCSARLQAFIVSRVARDRQCRAEFRALNPFLALPLDQSSEALGQQIGHNAQAVRDNYSLESSGMRLRTLYETVLQSPRCRRHPFPDQSSILDAFLSLQRFHPIRVD